jgi:hypothetical protein
MKNTTTQTTYQVLKPEKKIPPTVIFTGKSLKWIEAIIEAHETEVGFYGIVEEDEPNYTFRITDIFYPKHQLATFATCEISPEGEAAIMNWLINHNRTDDIPKMMLWGHSHNTMGVSPSGQDDKQALERMESTRNHIIRIIVNKEKLMSVAFFDFKKQVRFDNIVWKEDHSANEALSLTVLSEIQAVLSSTVSSTQKLIAIDKIMYSDPEMEEIVKKVAELKKINLDYPTPQYGGYNNGSFSNFDRNAGYTPLNEDRLPRLSGKASWPKVNGKKHKQFGFVKNDQPKLPLSASAQDDDFPSHEDLSPANAKSEVDSMLTDWDHRGYD